MKRFNNEKKKRKGEYLSKVVNILIFSEGTSTEPNYFDAFKKSIDKNAVFKNSVRVEKYGVGMDTVNVVNYARKFVKDNNIVSANIWCVYDKDDFSDVSFNRADELCKKYSKKDVIYESAWSNQSFEYWFVLNFAYYDADNDRSDYIEFLDKQFKKNKLGKYDKTNVDNYKILEKYGSPKNAILYADKRLAKCDGNPPSKCKPATKVHLLVRQLAQYLPEEEKKIYL